MERAHVELVVAEERGSEARLAREKIASLIAQGKDVKIIAIGRKGRDQLRRFYGSRIVQSFEVGLKGANFAMVKPITEKILAMFEAGEADVVTLIHSRFKSVVVQTPTARQLIPAVVESTGGNAANAQSVVYDYEPDEQSILEVLLPMNISVQLLSALLENQAGFFASQMAAMDNATRNAGEMIKKQTMQYNRTRQAMITKELIEIISGAEAL